MSFRILLLFSCAILSESAFIDTLTKCEINDGECQKGVLANSIKYLSKGLPELDIPPIDPFIVTNVSVVILGLAELTMVDGVVKGIKDCTFDKFETNMTAEHSTLEMTCDLSVKGHYKASADNPLITGILGGSAIKGDGNVRIKLEKFHIKLDFFFNAVKRDDGEIILKCKLDEIKYKYDLPKKATITVDNLYLGKEDISGLANQLLAQNWKMLLHSFGDSFMKKAVEIVYTFEHRFFEKIPAKNFISTDLTPFVAN